VLLLNSTPDTTGVIPESHAAAYRAFGNEIRRRFETPLKETGGEGNSIDLEFQQPTEVNHVILQEDLTKGQRVLAFSVEGMNEKGEWKELYAGTSVGYKRICQFEPLRVKKVRVSFPNAKARPHVASFSVYNITGVKLTPETRDDRDRFYDGVASKQGSAASREPDVKVGTWEVDARSDRGNELQLDLTRFMTKVGQYELTFAPRKGESAPDIRFSGWGVEMYGAKIDDAVELLKGTTTFRITRSQQTLDDFPTIFHVTMMNTDRKQSGIITIKRLTY
jgi:alpha-L-fucosidase